MCIAIYKPENVILSKTVLKNCFENNPDGAGFAYPDDEGKSIQIQNGFFGFRKFWQNYRRLQNKPMLIHFRIATSGKVDTVNCHPWRIDARHAMIHNGSIRHKLDGVTDDISDTGVFVKDILAPTFEIPELKGKKFWASGAFKWLMQESIGSNNKMVILAADGYATIFNEIQGEWEHEAWFSNKTYKEDRKFVRGTTVQVVTDCSGEKREIIKSASGRITVKYLGREPVKALPAPVTVSSSSQSKEDFQAALDEANDEFKRAFHDEGGNGGIDPYEMI